MKSSAILAAVALLLALPAAAQQMFFYPSQGQAPEQQTKDQGECHVWAVQQTGFDPANPPAAPMAAAAPVEGGQVIRGAARGSVLGVVGGAIAGDAGKGAAIGAATGALVGGMRRRDAYRAAGEQEVAAQQQYDAEVAQQRDGYNRALAACMQGRGYGAS